MDDAKNAVGKRAGVFFITDDGLFGSVKRTIQPAPCAEHSDSKFE